MRFVDFSSYLYKLESTASRNKMTQDLAELFKKSDKEEIDKVCYLALGRLAPKFASVQFNIAGKVMIKIIARAFGLSESEISRFFKKSGDLGDVVFELKLKAQSASLSVRQAGWRTKLKTMPTKKSSMLGKAGRTKNLKLSVLGVYSRLREIAEESGEGSVERKVEKMAELLQELEPLSAKYVIRITLEKLRLGFSEMTILDALSWMIGGDKSKREEIEMAYNVRADVGEIAKKLKVKRIFEELAKIKPQLGVPIMPALCQRLPTAEEMVEKMHKVAVEPKFDGQRLQAHYASGKKVSTYSHPQGVNIKIFTRNLEDVTEMFPDIVKAIPKEVKAEKVILDGEAVGFEPKTGKLLPFQETIKRKRKYQVKETAKEIPLRYFCFDLLYKDGKDWLGKPFKERREELERILKKGNKTIILSPQIVTDDPKVIRRYHDRQIKRGLEGAVLKKWEAAYDPGKRGYTWVKFKSELGKKGGGLADTVDCLVMGFNRGQGKRTGFGIGAFLVGVLAKLKTKNEKGKTEENFVTISKIGTGLSDEQWKKLKVKSQKLKVKKKPKNYLVDKNLYPDVWCSPKIVVEIEADNITKSPIHSADYALRFPRLVRFREDKGPAEATTLEEVERLYKMQK